MVSDLSLLIYATFVALLLLYSVLLFRLTNAILENRQSTKGLQIIFVVFNTALSVFATLATGSNSRIGYILVFIVLFIEFSLLYKNGVAKYLFCATATVLHVMAIRSLCTALFSLFYGKSIFDIAQNSVFLLLSMVITFLVLDLLLLATTKILPIKQLKIVCQQDTQLWFLTAWILVFDLYLLVNSSVYSQVENHPSLTMNQAIAPIAILLGLYIVLFFSIKTTSLLGYKEKSEELQIAITSEQQYRESMVKDSIMTYEFNVSKDIMLNGFEGYRHDLKDDNNCYSDIITYFAQKMQHPDDQQNCATAASPQRLLAQFALGITETVVEYRRLMPDGMYCWVKSVTNLVQDPITGDVKGFTYIKNIDDEKKYQAELQQQSERDSLTGLYNRGTMAKLIAKCISDTPDATGVLLIIDVDHFKSVNDNFGHIYGDAVLCELSEKLLYLFNDGVVGRLGGDEFIAYIKNPPNRKVICQKAEEICEAFRKDYMYETAQSVSVSASVGVAIYPEHGDSFEELYRNADIALYEVKNSGKNNYFIFDGQQSEPHEIKRTTIDTKGITAQKNFKGNRIEYVFKILYASDNPTIAIRAVLELVTNHFGFDRGYIFETSKDGRFTSNTFEWCRDDTEPQIQNLKNVPIEMVHTAHQSFYQTGQFLLESLNDLSPQERAVLEPQGIKSMFQFGLFDKDKLLGFIGFDNCLTEKSPTKEEIDEMLTICHILSTFFVKQRVTDAVAEGFGALTAAMNNLDSYTYVVKKDTFEVAFMNEKTAKVVGEIQGQMICYRDFRGQKAPCSDCPALGLTDDPESHCIREIYNESFDLWTETTASHLQWIDKEPTFFINSIDITKYKASV